MGLLTNPHALLQSLCEATQRLRLQALVVTGGDPGLEEAARTLPGVSPGDEGPVKLGLGNKGPGEAAPGDKGPGELGPGDSGGVLVLRG